MAYGQRPRVGLAGKSLTDQKRMATMTDLRRRCTGLEVSILLTNPLPPTYRLDQENSFVSKKLIEGDKTLTAEIISAGLDEAMNQEFNVKDHNESYD